MKRRIFIKTVAAGGLATAFAPVLKAAPIGATNLVTNKADVHKFIVGKAEVNKLAQDKPATNIAEAMAVPRNKMSMPGVYPGSVVRVNHPSCVIDGKPSEEAAYEMLKVSMLALTGQKSLKKAWLKFVGPKDIIGLKVNPVAGKLLTTSHAVTKAIVKQLEEAGISRKNLVIWDRREMQLHETGYTEENYPGIKITGTECEDAEGGYFNGDGVLYSDERVDKTQYFYADVEGEYDANTLPFMINGGVNSYFTRICTEQITKIINIPILKNAGAAVTLCMKNLAFGAVSNTGRLHQGLWHETCAYVCAFPPLRDKVVLNIVDGLKGCFDGGPAANPQFICNYNTMLVGSDPVAVDRIGHDIVIKKRIEEKIQSEDKSDSLRFMEIAQELKLGIADRNKIKLETIDL